MNRIFKISVSSLMAALMLASLAGCAGGGSSGPTSGPTTEPTAEPTTEAQTDAGAQATNTPKPGNIDAGVEVTPRPIPTLEPEPDSYDSGENKIVYTIPVGEGDYKIEYHPHLFDENGVGMDNGEEASVCPEDFCYFDGEFYVLDSHNYLDESEVIWRYYDDDSERFEPTCLHLPDSGYNSFAVEKDENGDVILYAYRRGELVIKAREPEYGGWTPKHFYIHPDYADGCFSNDSKLFVDDGKVYVVLDEPYCGTLMYDPQGREQALVPVSDRGLKCDLYYEDGIGYYTITNCETGVTYPELTAKALTEQMHRLHPDGDTQLVFNMAYTSFVYLPDGSFLTLARNWPKYINDEDYAYQLYQPMDVWVARFSKDGKLVAESDVWQMRDAANSDLPCVYGTNCIEYVDGHVYVMNQCRDRLEIREVAMHGVD